MILEQLDIYIQKSDLDTDLISFTNNNSKWIIDLIIKCKMYTLFITGENLGDLVFGNDFLYTI